MSQPFTAELPAAILAVVRAEPSGALGLSYRRYALTVLVPGVRQVAATRRGERCPQTPQKSPAPC